MTATPSITTTPKELHMKVPYPLNGAFRAIFKTAKWNSDGKVFVAAATPQNHKKWEKFIATVKDAVAVLHNADQAEATAEELERAAQEAERTLESALAAVKEFEQRASAARERRMRAEAQLIEFAPVREKARAALADVLDATAAAEGARDAVITPAITLYGTHGLERILANFAQAARRGHSGKEACGRARAEIIELRNDLKSIGFRVPAIDDLASVSLNRPDKIAQFVESIKATSHSGLELVDIEA
jgi:sirohydrochlorin ferrochelatase